MYAKQCFFLWEGSEKVKIQCSNNNYLYGSNDGLDGMFCTVSAKTMAMILDYEVKVRHCSIIDRNITCKLTYTSLEES